MLNTLLPSLTNLTTRTIPLALVAALAVKATAQTLVPNGGFEDTVHCTGWDPPFTSALHWTSANTATPDMYDADLVRGCGVDLVPGSDIYTEPYEGERFAGCWQWYGAGSSDVHEYLMARLLAPMEAGDSYRVSMHYALAPPAHMAIDRIGVYFAQDSLFQDDLYTIEVIPQVQLFSPDSGYLVSTDWVELADTFMAIGNERWMIFGTFTHVDDVNGIVIPGFPLGAAYYYFDDIRVEPVDAGSGIAEGPVKPSLELRGDAFYWYGSSPLTDAMLFDATGRVIRQWKPIHGSAELPYMLPTNLATGVYVLSVFSDTERRSVSFVKGGRD